jgi:hypothetical protein
MKKNQNNLVWVTNIPVPYRERLWQRVSSEKFADGMIEAIQSLVNYLNESLKNVLLSKIK